MTTEMKDSGVKWIGAVPADWKINKGTSKNRDTSRFRI